MPKISVIVPVYNAENELHRCIKSLIDQTFTDFEVILVDDGSVDKSGTICDEYAKNDKRFRALHQENRGVSVARNLGITEAVGEYIAFVDSDDYVEPEFLKELYDALKSHNADISMSNYYLVTGSETEKMSHGFSQNTFFDRSQIEEVIYHRIFSNNSTVGYFSLWNKLFRKSIIDKNGILFDADMSFGEDMIFILNYLKYAKSICFSDKTLYFYEMKQDGLFSSYRVSFLEDIMRCYETIIEQTEPENCSANAYLPLSVKYFWYIKRYQKGTVSYEKDKIRTLYKAFNNPGVIKIFKLLVSASAKDKELYGIDENDLQVPRLVLNKRLFIAIIYTVYQIDDKCLLRKIQRYTGKNATNN